MRFATRRRLHDGNRTMLQTLLSCGVKDLFKVSVAFVYVTPHCSLSTHSHGEQQNTTEHVCLVSPHTPVALFKDDVIRGGLKLVLKNYPTVQWNSAALQNAAITNAELQNPEPVGIPLRRLPAVVADGYSMELLHLQLTGRRLSAVVLSVGCHNELPRGDSQQRYGDECGVGDSAGLRASLCIVRNGTV